MADKGKTLSIYFNKEQLTFLNTEVDNILKYLQAKVDEDMKRNDNALIRIKEGRLKEINNEAYKLKKEIKNIKWKSSERKEKMNALFKRYDDVDHHHQKGWLTGATGQRLLAKAGMSRLLFIEEYKKWKKEVRNEL